MPVEVVWESDKDVSYWRLIMHDMQKSLKKNGIKSNDWGQYMILYR